MPANLMPIPARALLLLTLCAMQSAQAASFRWASSSNRIYIEDGGSATLSQIQAALPNAPLQRVTPGSDIWLLQAHLYVQDGSRLDLHGPEAGGDVGELRLYSANHGGEHNFITIVADHGQIDIQQTRIVSWDPDAQGPDTEYSQYGRAHIRVSSRFDSDGVTPLESRMDIVASEVAWLGYAGAEAYGLSWKVNGSGPDLYERLQVRGDIHDSYIHHNYFGIYTYGHQSGIWRNNEVSHNVQYGIDPHDDSDDLLIADNNVHDNGNHGIIASQRCDRVIIRNNRSYGNAGNGIMLHRDSNDAVVEGNQAYQNGDSGIAVFASSRAVIRNNELLDNALYGMRFSVGSADNLVEDNVVAYSGRHGLFFYQGSDAPQPGDDGRPKRNQFFNNHIHGSLKHAVRMKHSDANSFIGNLFENNGGSLSFVESSQVEFLGNQVPDDVVFRVSGSPGTPSSLHFNGQARIELQLQDHHSTAHFTDYAQAVFQPDESINNVVDDNGTRLTLTRELITSSSTVWRRELYVYPQGGSTVEVKDLQWTDDPLGQRHWRAAVADKDMPVNFTIRQLQPGQTYTAYMQDQEIARLQANGNGEVSFRAQPGTAAILDYRLDAGLSL